MYRFLNSDVYFTFRSKYKVAYGSRKFGPFRQRLEFCAGDTISNQAIGDSFKIFPSPENVLRLFSAVLAFQLCYAGLF